MPSNQLLRNKEALIVCRMLASASPDETYDETYEKVASYLSSSSLGTKENFHLAVVFAVLNFFADVGGRKVNDELRSFADNYTPNQGKFVMIAVDDFLKSYYQDMDRDYFKTSILMGRLAFDICKKSKTRRKRYNQLQLRLSDKSSSVFRSAWASKINYFAQHGYEMRTNYPSDADKFTDEMTKLNPYFLEDFILGAMGCYINIIHGAAKLAKQSAVEVIDELIDALEVLERSQLETEESEQN